MEDGWRTASKKFTDGTGTCVAIKYLTATPTVAGIGDTTDPDGDKLHVSAAAFGGLIGAIKARHYPRT